MCVPVGAQVLGAVKALEWDQRAHAHRSVSAQAIRDEEARLLGAMCDFEQNSKNEPIFQF